MKNPEGSKMLKKEVETPSEEAADKIEHFEIERLIEPMEKIIMQMHRRIASGDYRMIIGDDASGRVPTFIFDRFLKRVYEKQGMLPPETIFVAGSGHIQNEERQRKILLIEGHLQKYHEALEKVKEEKKKVLIVTETIATGNGLRPLTAALKSMGVDFEVAAVGGDIADHARLQDKLGGRIFFGEPGTPPIYNEDELSGVWKDKHEVLAHARTKDASDDRVAEIQEKINSAREDAKIVADELFRRYEPRMRLK